jgi:hypothetical protein
MLIFSLLLACVPATLDNRDDASGADGAWKGWLHVNLSTDRYFISANLADLNNAANTALLIVDRETGEITSASINDTFGDKQMTAADDFSEVVNDRNGSRVAVDGVEHIEFEMVADALTMTGSASALYERPFIQTSRYHDSEIASSTLSDASPMSPGTSSRFTVTPTTSSPSSSTMASACATGTPSIHCVKRSWSTSPERAADMLSSWRSPSRPNSSPYASKKPCACARGSAPSAGTRRFMLRSRPPLRWLWIGTALDAWRLAISRYMRGRVHSQRNRSLPRARAGR